MEKLQMKCYNYYQLIIRQMCVVKTYILPLNKLEKPALGIQKQFLKKIEDTKAEKDIKSSFENKYWIKMSEDKNSFTYFRNLLKLLEKNGLDLKNIAI